MCQKLLDFWVKKLKNVLIVNSTAAQNQDFVIGNLNYKKLMFSLFSSPTDPADFPLLYDTDGLVHKTNWE